VPGFVDDAVRVVAGVAEVEAEVLRVVAQPGEGGGVLETFLGRWPAGCADVDGVAAVVFGKTRGGIDGEDVVDGKAAQAFAAEDAELVGVAAVAGNRIQQHAVEMSCVSQPAPCGCGSVLEP